MTRCIHTPVRISSLLAIALLSISAASPQPPGTGESVVNRVLKLDGTSDFMRVPDSPALHTFTDAITMELWFKASSFYPEDGQVNSLIRKNVWAGEENFFLRFRIADGTPWLEVSAGVQIGTLQTYHEHRTGRWYHLAGTYDGRVIVAYVNGERIDSQPASGPMYISDADLFIGKGDPEFSEGEFFHGALDEIRLWNVARSPEQIRATMDATLTGNEKGLVAYWNFDDGTTSDQSGHGLSGLLPQIAKAPRPVADAPAEEEPAPQLPGFPALILRPKRLAGILDDLQPVFIRRVPDRIHICWLTEHINREESL